MAVTTFFLCLQIMLLVCFLAIHGGADNSTSFSCSVDSLRSCRTYVSYFAKSSEFMDLVSISNLFGVSALEIAKASNLGSERTPLFDGQLLLVPVACNCNGNGSFFASITYKIKKHDTFYYVSTTSFENLCDWKLVGKINPTLNPIKLQVGDEVVFPLFCKCPDEKNLKQGIEHLITYIWQPTDGISGVSELFNVSEDSILEEMKYQNLTHFEAGKPVFIPVSKLPLLSQSYSQRKHIKHLVFIIVVVALGLSFLLGVSLVVYICFIYRKKKLPIWGSSSFERSNLTKMKMKQSEQVLPPVVSDYLGRPILYEYKVITDATMNFHEGFKIGKSVYRGTINGQISVIKEAKSDSKEELMILQKVNHINLVKMVGFSSDEKDNFYLVYEFAENGSLDKWLHSPSAASSGSVNFHLTWKQRLNIALDVANGLQYMHDHTQPSIVHKDIKTSCILLDLRFRAKISNLAKARPATGSLSTKVDVFAFGVVILELLSGEKAMDCKEIGQEEEEKEEEVEMLCKEIRDVLDNEERREEKLRDWIDPKLQSFYPIEGALSLAVMARACTQDKPLSRPSMAEIVFNLCVLAESSIEGAEKSWVSLLEADEIGHSHSLIRAR